MEYKYLKNNITKPTTYFVSPSLDGNGIAIPDLKSFDVNNIRNLLKSYPEEYYLYIKVEEDSNMEKLSLDIYGDPNYHDILLLLNDMDPIIDMPYDYDTLVDIANKKVEEYKRRHKVKLTQKDYDRLYEKYESELLKDNVVHGEIMYIKPTYIHEVLNKAYELGLLTSNVYINRT